MTRFGKTVFRLVYDPREHPPEVWRWTDWAAMVAVGVVIVIVFGFWL